MPQLQLFEAAPQPQPNLEITANVSAREAQAKAEQKNSQRQPKPTAQQTQSAISQAIVSTQCSPQGAIAPQVEPQPTRSNVPAVPTPMQADELDEPERITPAQSAEFDPLKQCRLCGAPIKHGGLDHSLCSGNCGWVVDLTWLAAHPPKRSKEPEPQAATHTPEERAGETLDLFLYAIENHTSDELGGAE